MASYTPSSNIAELRASATIAVSARAKALRAAGRPVIDLGAGEPDFPTPAFVVEAANLALEAGATRYTQVEGILPLRQAIAERASAIHGGKRIEPEDVVVTAGTKQALFNACFSLFGDGRRSVGPHAGLDQLLRDAQVGARRSGRGVRSPGAPAQGHARRLAACGDAEDARSHSQLAVQSHRRRVLPSRARRTSSRARPSTTGGL